MRNVKGVVRKEGKKILRRFLSHGLNFLSLSLDGFLLRRADKIVEAQQSRCSRRKDGPCRSSNERDESVFKRLKLFLSTATTSDAKGRKKKESEERESLEPFKSLFSLFSLSLSLSRVQAPRALSLYLSQSSRSTHFALSVSSARTLPQSRAEEAEASFSSSFALDRLLVARRTFPQNRRWPQSPPSPGWTSSEWFRFADAICASSMPRRAKEQEK